MRFLEKLFETFGGDESDPKAKPQPQTSPGAPLTQAQLMEQRRALTASVVTPEQHARLAQAYAAKDARQRIGKALQTDAGSQAMVDVLRNLMRKD
jgi:hypothetical protein